MSKRNLAHIADIIFDACKKANFDVPLSDIRIERTRQVEHGHFACNIAMIMAKKLGKNPREVAEAITKNLSADTLEKADIAGPGFINMWMKPQFYATEFQALTTDVDDYLKETLNFKPGEKTMISDTSHPNVAKPMGVHHLLSTIIGASINSIYKKTGWKVIRDNYIGDMGTQFGKLISAIKKWGNLDEIEKDPIPHLLKLYVQFHFEADKDVELDDEGRAEFKKFEDGDKENRELWKKIRKWSLDEMQPIYDRLKVEFDLTNGEAFYEDKMAPILEKGREKGIIVDGERGAWIIMPEDPNDPPTLVRKSDGASLYMTRDLAQTQYWEEEYNPHLMVWVVDVAQSLHFRQRIAAHRKLGQSGADMVHVPFGRMQFKDGAMSTRKGNILALTDLLDEAEKRALDLVKEKGHHLTPEEQIELARIIGIGSVKYNVLSQNRTSNITFDWDQMLAFEGNSAPYLIYTATRANSVLNKAGVSIKDASKADLELDDDHEVLLAQHLLMFPDALARARDEFKPNHIANFLYELAQSYNSLYNSLNIASAETEAAKATRLKLTATTVAVMRTGLELLGIELPEKM